MDENDEIIKLRNSKLKKILLAVLERVGYIAIVLCLTCTEIVMERIPGACTIFVNGFIVFTVFMYLIITKDKPQTKDNGVKKAPAWLSYLIDLISIIIGVALALLIMY